MNSPRVRFGVLASTGGAVLGALLESAWFRERVALVATDRPCGAVDRAATSGIAHVTVDIGDAVRREGALDSAFAAAGVTHVFLFYTRLVRHALLERWRGRLWNLHPALLPGFPGAHGFEAGWTSGVPMLGTTLHAIDAGLDTGPPLLQTAFARATFGDAATTRHAVFEQQVRSALQAAHWLAAGRVETGERAVRVSGAPPAVLLDGALYSPGLDAREALTWRSAPVPVGEARP